MTLQIHEVGAGQCKFVLNDKPPFYVCGDPVRDETVSYCPKHAAICLRGKGTDWRQLVDLIYRTEHTIKRTA